MTPQRFAARCANLFNFVLRFAPAYYILPIRVKPFFLDSSHHMRQSRPIAD